MRELGSHGDALHAGLAPAIIEARVDRLILIGEEMARWSTRSRTGSRSNGAQSVDQATELLLRLVRPGDAVLVKASNSVGLARLVERVVREPACST